MRGTRTWGAFWEISARFIPACAGNSLSSSKVSAAKPVHPRVCGELAPCCHQALRASRFIPACAGNSTGRRGPQRTPPVHPRVCGELQQPPGGGPQIVGSSPRVRGTPVAGPRRRPVGRFIPACAGNSTTGTRTCASSPVHPRVCGELAVVDLGGREPDGSSPRVRGTRPRAGGSPTEGRFIPACAGNSLESLPLRPPRPVHPRVCGELGKANFSDLVDSGSSPRVRGTPQLVGDPLAGRRFIPACAGNSTPPSRAAAAAASAAVHPRVCGELVVLFALAVHPHGSSPRVRGTQRQRLAAVRCARFIPACAGNSLIGRRQAAGLPGSSPRVRGTLVGC